MLIFLGVTRPHIQAYESSFNLLSLSTLVLLFVKHHGIVRLSSSLAFLPVYIAAWLAAILLLVVTVSTVRSIVLSVTNKLFLKLPSVSLFGGMAIISGLSHLLLLFAVENYFITQESSLPITRARLLPSSLLYIVVHSLIAALLLVGYIPGETSININGQATNDASNRVSSKGGYDMLRDQAI